jgi:hypothetical protein
VVGEPGKTWECSGCGTRVEPPFAVCYSCGTNWKGEPDPNFEREVDAAVEADLQWAEAERTSNSFRHQRWQFSLRGLLLFVFVLCGLLAIFSGANPILWYVVLCILVTNALGVVVAWIITYVFRIPNDGSNLADHE